MDFNFEIGQEYAWIESFKNVPTVSFVKVTHLDKHYQTKEIMVELSNHPYYFCNELYSIKDIRSDLKYYNVKLIKIESEQQKLALTLKYE